MQCALQIKVRSFFKAQRKILCAHQWFKALIKGVRKFIILKTNEIVCDIHAI